MSDLLSLLIDDRKNKLRTPPDLRRQRPLGNNGNRSSPSGQSEPPDTARTLKRWARRRERYELRGKLRSLTRLERVAKCGWVTVGPGGGGDGGPGLRVSPNPQGGGDLAGFSGLSTCSSVWACPACAAKIATRRADELGAVMKVALERGCSATLVTLTMRHHEGMRLKDCWDALSKAWAAVTSGKQWAGDKEKYALRGWVKAVEVTRGKSGWHVHLHALMIWDNDVNLIEARHVGRRMWQRWDAALGRSGFTSLRDLGGLDVRMASLVAGTRGGLHEYFVKLAHEITGGQAKLARGGGRVPFQILADVFAGGEASDVEAWHEWEQASSGRRQIAWSQDLRKWASLGEEQSDEEVMADELGADDMLFIAPDSWRAIRSDPGQVCHLLEQTELGGYTAAKRWLTMRGLSYAILKRLGLKRGDT